MGFRYNRNAPSRKLKGGYEANRISGRDYAESNTKRDEIQSQEFELAEVVDVIRDSSHPDYTANEDIGKAKVRRVFSQFDQDEDSLGYTQPMNGRLKSWPLEYELVLVTELNDKPFYLQTANWRSNPNQNTAARFSVNKIPTDSQTQDSYSQASAGITQTTGTEEVDVEGEEFEVSETIKPLRHRAGDTVVEGRFGNSIRVGRDGNMNPLIQLRVGQRSDVENADFLEPFFEDINDDPTSIYLTDEGTEFPLDPDQTSAELEPATTDFDDHLFSAENPPDAYDNAQILLATNRVVLNAKERQIMGFSERDTNWVTNANFTVDAKERIKTLSINGHLHISESYFDVLPEGNIHLATENENEPVARGQQTHDRLVAMLETLIQETHPTPAGPSSPPTQAARYQQILQQVRQTVRSEKIFVDNVGENVQRPVSPTS